MGSKWSWWFSSWISMVFMKNNFEFQTLCWVVKVQWKSSFCMRKPSTSYGSHFTNTCSILKSLGVLKRAGSEVLIFEVFKVVCKIFDMQPCNSTMKQNNQHFARDSRGGGPRTSAHTAIRASHHRQIEEEHPLNNLPNFGANPFIRKKCRFMHISDSHFL